MTDSKFRIELEELINRCSLENGSDTPDFILADYLNTCLSAFDSAVRARDQWYTRPKSPTPMSHDILKS